MGIAKYKINYNFFNEKEEEYWYFVGLIASDGYITDERIELGLNNKDKYILENLRDMICPGKPIYDKIQTNSSKFTIDNKKIAKDFKEIFKMKTNKKHSEMIFPNVPSIYMKDFIRGYVDGDGSIGRAKAYQTVNGNKVIYNGIRLRILGNEIFLSQMLECIRKEIPNNTKSISKRKGENVYEITFNFKTAENILHWLYDNNKLCLKRKEEKFKEIMNEKMKI